jgi:Uma2 family endonuclease
MVSVHPLPESRHHYTYAEYLEYERDSALKHEFDNGRIFAMAGGSRRHSALAARMTVMLGRDQKAGCHLFQSDQRVRILATGRATYPDVSMVCGAIEGDPADPRDETISNPSLIVEVLSPSTEDDDRGSKWLHYQRLPSLEEYVLVSQAEQRIERYRRLDSGAWEYRDFTSGIVELRCGAKIDIEWLFAELPA